MTKTINSNVKSHGLFWWALKVALGLVLIGAIVARFIFEWQSLFVVPTWIAQLMVLLGFGISIWHFTFLKAPLGKAVVDVGVPNRLVSERGLYRWIRHPMYLGDLIAYSGLLSFCVTPFFIGVYLLAVFALVKQAVLEDQFMAASFSEQHKGWRVETKLIIPFLF